MQDLFILMFVVRKLDGLTIKGKTMELARDSKGRFISTKKGQTMSKTYTYNSVSELVQAISGNELYGLAPAEKYDATKFNYPITVTVNKTDKTFSIKETKVKTETKVQEPVTQTTEKEPFYKKSWFPFAVIATIVAIVIIVLIVV